MLARWTYCTLPRHCTRFVSGDDRQLAVAKASGLTVIDIKRRIERLKQ